MTNEDYSSKRKASANGGEGGNGDDVWTRRLDLLLKAVIAIATVLGPAYLAHLSNKNTIAVKEAVNHNIKSVKSEVKTSAEATAVLTAETAAEVKRIGEEDLKNSTYTKAVTAEWWAERTGNPKAAVQAEEARNKLEAMQPTAVPPPSLDNGPAPASSP